MNFTFWELLFIRTFYRITMNKVFRRRPDSEKAGGEEWYQGCWVGGVWARGGYHKGVRGGYQVSFVFRRRGITNVYFLGEISGIR